MDKVGPLLKRCPICNARPWAQIRPLKGCNGVEALLINIECSKCGIIRTEGTHTYDKSERAALLSAAEEWSDLVDEANNYLGAAKNEAK